MEIMQYTATQGEFIKVTIVTSMQQRVKTQSALKCHSQIKILLFSIRVFTSGIISRVHTARLDEAILCELYYLVSSYGLHLNRIQSGF